MIYIIEINYTDPQSEAEWNAWYEDYLRKMVTVPGILTAQRFLGENAAARKHLAVYTLAGLSVYAEPRYREVGGGGFASAKWKANINRRRNLYDGVELVPEVGEASRFLIADTEPEALDLPDVFLVPIEITDMRAAQADPSSPVFGQAPFENNPARRGLAIVPADRAADLAQRGTIAVYRPSSPRLIGRRPVARAAHGDR